MNDRVSRLEDRNAELAKEILLNESAIYEAESEIDRMDEDVLDHPQIAQSIAYLNLLIARLQEKNEIYKKEIFNNELEINRLRNG